MLCGMKEPLTLIHERVDDIPLLLGIMNRLGLAELVDQHLGNHGNQQGLSNGWVLTIWLAFILAVGDHRKSTVRAWVQQHQQTLERLTGQTLRPDGIDYTDDRLGIVLRRLSDTDGWNKLEAQLWGACTMDVYAFTMDGVHVDSTTVSGYHTVTENGGDAVRTQQRPPPRFAPTETDGCRCPTHRQYDRHRCGAGQPGG